jgi:hypothetical protein
MALGRGINYPADVDDLSMAGQQLKEYRTDGPTHIENRIVGTPVAASLNPGSMVPDGDMGGTPGRTQTTEAGPSREDMARNPDIRHTLQYKN